MNNPEITRREVMEYFGLQVPQAGVAVDVPVLKANETGQFEYPKVQASAASEIAEYFIVDGEK